MVGPVSLPTKTKLTQDVSKMTLQSQLIPKYLLSVRCHPGHGPPWVCTVSLLSQQLQQAGGGPRRSLSDPPSLGATPPSHTPSSLVWLPREQQPQAALVGRVNLLLLHPHQPLQRQAPVLGHSHVQILVLGREGVTTVPWLPRKTTENLTQSRHPGHMG